MVAMSIVRQVSHIDSLLLATTISGGFHSLESGTFSPECDVPENEEFNNHISIVHICSEHAIGTSKADSTHSNTFTYTFPTSVPTNLQLIGLLCVMLSMLSQCSVKPKSRRMKTWSLRIHL